MRTRVASLLACLVVIAGVLAFHTSSAVALQPPPAQEEYLPIDQLPPSEQLPGGVFVVIAYGFIWLAVMAYLWSIWRRLGKVEEEIQALQRRTGGSRG